ncbi:hypothetical protein BAY61_05185 [Prauserella marina]|uniref:TetR/AcrR family transcriptional regulator, transcriptional repressor for nem operon n=1 Tax=Prauserella marina TaxID=530584 RepID=A0A222VKX8_9PSEU|nr:TetR/AcrR family transcriptional regulator [Prauserella marina]ASR34482.1 hypothetical protein BAY61_05185 [Prauserella marina]PWV85921.1 TetR family transcriptional regulator [Prauserella marina]SDC42283.1 TetR/AcrR family transcriptional regulator, transcriptional repressor for nem operon [Prauserella marina]
MTRTGRPRGFEEDHVVEGAKGVFWQRGYAATSLRELAKELDVLPGSLHATFGSKHDLYLRALRDYVNDASEAAAEISGAASPLSALRALLGEVLESASATPGRGCMLGNSALELAPQDEPVRELVESGLHALERGIEEALLRARDTGEISADVDCAAQARLLVVLLQGLHVTARAEADPQRLTTVIDTALSSITPPSSRS